MSDFMILYDFVFQPLSKTDSLDLETDLRSRKSTEQLE